jgi:hypothetical protein
MRTHLMAWARSPRRPNDQENKARVLVGPDAKLYDLLVRVTDPAYERLSGELTARAIMRRITSEPDLELG